MSEIDAIIAYEQGELGQKETIRLFQALINDGLAWKLQGAYGRTAMSLVHAGLCTLPGKPLVSYDDVDPQDCLGDD